MDWYHRREVVNFDPMRNALIHSQIADGKSITLPETHLRYVAAAITCLLFLRQVFILCTTTDSSTASTYSVLSTSAAFVVIFIETGRKSL